MGSIKTYKKQARQPLDPRITQLLTDWLGTPTQIKNGATDGNA